MNGRHTRRVVVTGMGIISPLGVGLEPFWHGLLNAESGISPIRLFDARHLRSGYAGQAHDFDPLIYFSSRDIRRLDRFSQLALAAAQMASEDAALETGNGAFSDGGTFLGTGIGGISSWAKVFVGVDGSRLKMDAFSIPRVMSNAAAAHLAITMGLKGPNQTLNTACSAGAQAVGLAFHCLRHGLCELAFCGGAEAPLTPEIMGAWEKLGVVSGCNSPAAVKPFDARRDGFVLAEGAAIMVLESSERALERGARIYAEIGGFVGNCDAFALTAPSENGIAEALRLVLKQAGLTPGQIDHINTHGTATRINDRTEAAAIKAVFQEHASRIPVTANKGALGHAMGAASALELAATVLAVHEKLVPPTAHLEQPDPECGLNCVYRVPRRVSIEHALCNAFGFGGSNAVLHIRKWHPGSRPC